MLAIATDLHLQDPDRTDARILASGSIVETVAAGPVVEFPELSFDVAGDQDVLVYFEQRRQFMQQSARILSVDDGEAGRRLTLELVGDPVSAENRAHFRVPVTVADIFATVDGRDGCRMLDVSITGFAVLTRQSYDVGAEVSASFSLDGRSYDGAMVVQSVRDLGRPGLRCGLRVRQPSGADAGLAEGVRALALHAEREMLRRVSGRE